MGIGIVQSNFRPEDMREEKINVKEDILSV